MSLNGRFLGIVATTLILGLLPAGGARASEPPPGTPPSFVPLPSIHQREWLKHQGQPLPEPEHPFLYGVAPEIREGPARSASTLTRIVYGFQPYWTAEDLSHIRWNLLSHVAYFAVALNSDGSVTNLAGSYAWPSGFYVTALRDAAHANGVKVILAATNFSSSSITTLLSSATYRQNAIDNLKALVEGYGDGVNIDLEGVPASQKANLVTFMTDLTTTIHSAVPGSHVSVCTPAVDWSGAFDYGQLAMNCDGLFIMGYDYYHSGSSTAGPSSPLTSGGVWGTYSLTWTVNDYLTSGGTANRSKYILGVPYYGNEWATASTYVPSSTTAEGTAMTYDSARANAATYGRLWDAASQTPYYVYTSGGAHQGWYDDAESLGYKWDLVNSKDLGGTGIWALNYDTADDLLWNQLQAKFAQGPCPISDPYSLCLNQSRFQVTVHFKNYNDGSEGDGHAVSFTPVPNDSGYFWFFSAGNMELLVKVLDGRGVNGNFWVFYGALSDVEYTVSLLDTVTGATKTYTNPPHHMASVADVNALPGQRTQSNGEGWMRDALARGEIRSVSELIGRVPQRQVPVAPELSTDVNRGPYATGCVADSTTLCLTNTRFQVRSSWRSYTDGTAGPGRSVPVTGESGCFWFFQASNIELAVKVLDGTGVNGRYWVLYGALSDVNYDITVQDTVTGATKTYTNPAHQLASVADVNAFAP